MSPTGGCVGSALQRSVDFMVSVGESPSSADAFEYVIKYWREKDAKERYADHSRKYRNPQRPTQLCSGPLGHNQRKDAQNKIGVPESGAEGWSGMPVRHADHYVFLRQAHGRHHRADPGAGGVRMSFGISTLITSGCSGSAIKRHRGHGCCVHPAAVATPGLGRVRAGSRTTCCRQSRPRQAAGSHSHRGRWCTSVQANTYPVHPPVCPWSPQSRSQGFLREAVA